MKRLNVRCATIKSLKNMFLECYGLEIRKAENFISRKILISFPVSKIKQI